MNLDMKTYDSDGRIPIGKLSINFLSLLNDGWEFEEIAVSEREENGEKLIYPIFSFRTKKQGDALYLLSGIHGEEPAGPNAIAKGLDYIKSLGMEMPIVLLPLCNPLGYAKNWRYPRVEKWEAGKDDSVGDSDHLLFLKDSKNSRRTEPKNSECDALTKHILKLSEDYKPFLTIDLHEDDLLHEGGYIYINGEEGYESKVGRKIIELLSKKIPIKFDGETGFKERIVGGIVANEKDGSIDELFSSKEIYVGGKITRGPSAKTSIVVETPATMPLERRVNAHLEVIKNLRELARLA